MNRADFPMLKQDLIYFDNAATSFKPKEVIKAMDKYYEEYSANAYRSDYKLSNKVDHEYEKVRNKVCEFIGAKKDSEVVFTSGATESLNMVVNGYLKNILKKGDEVLVTKGEHSSLLLPLFELMKEKGIVIKYIPLTKEYKVTLDNVKKSITKKTKVIALAHISNVIGDIRPIKKICEVAKEHNIVTLIDGAQSVSHIPVNVSLLDCDFYCFSGHKMCGPTGIGILYGKYELLNNLKPTTVGGSMNISFDSSGEVIYKELPQRLEAGTQNIAGIIGLGAAINYLTDVGFSKIKEYEEGLAHYLVKELKKIKKIKIYNENNDAGIIVFNYDNIFAQDLAIYLDKYNICVRAGSHCVRTLEEYLGIKNTCRISLAFYNDKKEIDELIKVLSNENITKELL